MTNNKIRNRRLQWIAWVLGISGAVSLCLWLVFNPKDNLKGIFEEDDAEHGIRNLITTMLIYNNTYGTKCPPSLAALGPPPPGEALSARAAGLTDAETASGVKRTYEIQFSCNPSPFAFTITADPLDNSVYKDHIFVDQTLVIRRQNGARATVFSLPVNLRYWASSPARGGCTASNPSFLNTNMPTMIILQPWPN